MDLKIKDYADYLFQYKQSIIQPSAFWEHIARNFNWAKPWNKVVDWSFDPFHVSWFEGATLNVTENCIDRYAITQPDAIAIVWEPNNPNEVSRKITYKELAEKVGRYAALLVEQGIQTGDRVCIYMPMIPEAAFAMLACARIGAIHSVVFAGFSAQALADRINDSDCKLLFTADGMFRGDKEIEIQPIVEEALLQCPSILKVLYEQRINASLQLMPNRDVWVDEALLHSVTPASAVAVPAEHPLFILYTSGSTGKPKGVVHTTGGYMVGTAYTFANVFQYTKGDVYWCTADIGWVTGHSYLIYGPLLNGATTLMFEGIPTWPDAGRFWEIIDKHQVSIFYTAPTAIRSLMAMGLSHVQKHRLQSLKTIGSVGEPINEEAWHWYAEHIGKNNCPVVDTWWQTETGAIMLSALSGISPLKPAHAGQPLPGVQPVLLDNEGNELEGNDVEGNLCVKYPWPSMLRTTWGDHERCEQTYFSTFKGYYFTGDGARRDENGFYRIIGRVDDVINVSGHRFGTAEIENAINEHPDVIESAVVGYPHDIKGQGIYAFIITEKPIIEEPAFIKGVEETVARIIGKIAKPDKIQVVTGLPKTRSGKIMRRVLRKVAAGEVDNFGDTSTLLDPTVVAQIVANRK